MLIISRREARVTLHGRSGGSWSVREHRRSEPIEVDGAPLPVDELYGQ